MEKIDIKCGEIQMQVSNYKLSMNYSLRPTKVVKTFLYECSKNIVKISLLRKENDFSFNTLE